MPSQQEIGKVLVEFTGGLSHQAIGRILASGLIGVSTADTIKYWRILTCGPQDEEELRLGTTAAESMGTTLGQSVLAFLQDLGLTEDQGLDMPVPEFQQPLEEG